MSQFHYMLVDAFCDRPLAGNPCAVVFDTEDMSDTTMQAVAREMNLSETAFVRRSSVADFGVRYFTPAEEIPMAGHPTIATTFALVESGRLPLRGIHTAITLELKVGPIPVEIFGTHGKIERIVMTQKKPQFLAIHAAETVLPVFGLNANDALAGVPIQTVSTGTPQLMLPLRDLAALRRARLDIPAYDRLRAQSDFFSPHLFCLQGFTASGHTASRHFGSPPDTLEDPFTGSATGAMAAHLWRYGLIDEARFLAEQGHDMNRPGQGTVEIIGPRDDIETVKVGGGAVTVIRGELEL